MKHRTSRPEPPGGFATSRSVLSRARRWSVWLGPLAVAMATGLVACTPPPPPPGQPIAVHAGYYDTHHAGSPQPKPNPWLGSANVAFVGQPDGGTGGWDSSAVRIDNISGTVLTGVAVTVDIGSNHYALWGASSIPAGATLILAQQGFETFDGSDLNPAGCVGCDPSLCMTAVSSTIPVVHVVVGGTTMNFIDSAQVLNTHGVDSSGCPDTGARNDESEPWQQLPSG
jgi:hypothetical protein